MSSFTFLFKLIVFIMIIFFLKNAPESKKFNMNSNTSSIISSSNSINNTNISIIASTTNFINNLNISNIKVQNNNNKTINQNNEYEDDFNKCKEYIENAREGKILYEENLEYSQNPLISVVIALFNNDKYINDTLKSVQNQKMKDIEIILIDDCSEDNSAKYAEEEQKKDPRIILIKNNKNMGILYSRGIGVLKARGKYIFPLDGDDLIMTDDLFDYIYEEIEKGKYDIVEFSWINSYIYELVENSFYNKPFCIHSSEEVIYQPELRQRFNRDEKGKFHLPDRYIWGKIISKDLYIKSIEVIGEDLEQKITAHEDTIIAFMFSKYGKSFKKIEKIGIFHFLNSNTSSATYFSPNFVETTCNSYVNYIDILYKHIENTTMAKEDIFYEFNQWLILNKCKFYKYGLEKKINITKKIYNDLMIPKQRKIEIKNFLNYITSLISKKI